MSLHRGKVLVALLLATVALFPVWSSGQPEEAERSASDEPVVIRWLKKGGLGSTEARIAILQETQPELMSRVEIAPESGDPHTIVRQLRLALASGTEIPDVIKLDKRDLVEFVEAGVVLDLTDMLEPYQDSFLPAAYELSRLDGRLWGVTNQVKSKLWFYRQDMFEEAGIDVDAINSTDDFIAAGLQLQETFPGAMMWNFGPQMAHYNLSMITSGNGARYFDDDGNYIVASDPGVRQAFVDLKRMQDAGIIADVSDWTPDWEQAFASGEIASTLQASWFARGYLQNWAPEQEGLWAVREWPTIAGAVDGRGSEASGSVYAIMSDSENIDLAFEILLALTLDPDTAYQLIDTRGVDPTSNAVFDAYPEAREPIPYYANNYWDAIDAAHAVFDELPYSVNSAREHDIMNDYLQRWLNGEFSDIDECLQRAENELTEQIGNAFEF